MGAFFLRTFGAAEVLVVERLAWAVLVEAGWRMCGRASSRGAKNPAGVREKKGI